MLDLFMGGCRIESPVIVESGVLLKLPIYAPDIEWPLMIRVNQRPARRADGMRGLSRIEIKGLRNPEPNHAFALMNHSPDPVDPVAMKPRPATLGG
jgi:hypothetical protein